MLYKSSRIKLTKDDSIKKKSRSFLDAQKKKKATRGITTESVYSEYPIA